MTLAIDDEFRTLIPALREDERNLLQFNLVTDGCRDALVVWKDVLIDGHNRFDICQSLGIPFKTKQIEFESRNHAKVWILENQSGRRNLTDDQRAYLASDLIEARSALEMAEQRKEAGKSGPKIGRKSPKLTHKEEDSESVTVSAAPRKRKKRS